MKELDNLKIIVSEFLNKNKLKIFVATVIILIILLFNYFLRMYKSDEPITTKNSFAMVMNPETKVPSKVFIESEALIVNFANKSSEGNYEAAYNMLSPDCQADVFGTLNEFKEYAKANFPKDSRYEIIPYSKVGTTYIYQVKVFEDFLATGLTYSNYSYIDLKMAINETITGEKLLSVAGYIGKFPLNSVFENDYIRVELTQRTSFYNEETYSVIVTNRTENDIILKDYSLETPEVQLSTGGDARPEISHTDKIIISSHQTLKFNMSFARFYDENSLPGSIVFSAIRVVKKGKITNYKSNDILAKFSIAVPIVD